MKVTEANQGCGGGCARKLDLGREGHAHDLPRFHKFLTTCSANRGIQKPMKTLFNPIRPLAFFIASAAVAMAAPQRAVDPDTIRDKVSMTLGQEFHLKFQPQGDQLLQPAKFKATGNDKATVKIALKVPSASPVPGPKGRRGRILRCKMALGGRCTTVLWRDSKAAKSFSRWAKVWSRFSPAKARTGVGNLALSSKKWGFIDSLFLESLPNENPRAARPRVKGVKLEEV